MSLKQNDEYEEQKKELTEENDIDAILKELRDKKMPDHTFFGDWNFLVHQPLDKFYNTENPRPHIPDGM